MNNTPWVRRNFMYTYHEEVPSCDKYNELREAVGWGTLDPDAVTRSLPRSLYVITAKYNNEIIAFARVVGDGGLCFYIQEIVVHPHHQKKGIGTEFMKHIFEYIKKNAADSSYLGVFVGKGLEHFYSRFGYWERPTSRMGPGMIQFWNDPELNDYLSSR
jgi:GNAT superfamily N-acetyltransferase